jgi:hypothetical protein
MDCMSRAVNGWVPVADAVDGAGAVAESAAGAAAAVAAKRIEAPITDPAIETARRQESGTGTGTSVETVTDATIERGITRWRIGILQKAQV